MGGSFRPLEAKCFEKFLRSIGFEQKRTKGSHDLWTKKGKRTIPVWGNEKQLPPFHLKSDCKTIGITMEFLYAWAIKNC